MRIAIMGAGCIGGLIGAALAETGRPVTLIDRGEQLRALQAKGLTVERPDGSCRHFNVPTVTGEAAECGRQDVVFIALKAHQITGALGDIASLIGPGTIVVSLQNGIPWWYFQRHGGALEGTVLKATDPSGHIGAVIPAARVVGCVAYPAVSKLGPAHILHVEGNRFPVGALDGRGMDDARLISRLFVEAGFKSPVLEDIRAEIWLKAIGNMSLNPVSALTQATLVDICEHDDGRALVRRMMKEGEAVAAALGISLRVSIDRRLEGARKVGKHRSSMLQDVEHGERLEIDALVSAISELGRLTGVPTPATDVVLALVRVLNSIVQEEGVAIRRVAMR